MSFFETAEPVASAAKASAVESVLEARPRSIGTLTVGRVLPSQVRRMVGPFTFLDHMGPVEFAPSTGADVPPHPHIGLATVTYLFEGEMVHRDSLGFQQPIEPGAINWMHAGRGIAHSERTPPELRRSGSRLHGLQLWVALPKESEESDPDFEHHPAATLPQLEVGGALVRILAGTAYGVMSPVGTASPLFYVEASIPPGESLPLPREHRERAAYVVEGTVVCGPDSFGRGRMLVFAPGSKPVLRAADAPARVMLLGGAPLEGPRHIWWNFVSSSKERIEQAKRDWKEGRFPKVKGDEQEFVPLPA
jgi:redox-sensitive bicupin YhaK (pirin superfamily)